MGILDSSLSFIGLDGDTIGDITGSNKAADTALQASRLGSAATTDMFNRSVELNQPFLDLGLRNLQNLEGEVSGMTPEGRLDQISKAFQTSPGFNNSLTLGRDVIEGGAAGGSHLFSGKTAKDLERFRTDLVNKEYGNFSNQYNQLEDSRLNRLAALGGIGQTSANTITGLQQNQGANLAQGYQNVGSIEASRAMAPFNTALQVGSVAGGFF